MRRDRSAVDAVDRDQLSNAPVSFVAGHKRLDLRLGQPPLDVEQIAGVGNPRILCQTPGQSVVPPTDVPQGTGWLIWAAASD